MLQLSKLLILAILMPLTLGCGPISDDEKERPDVGAFQGFSIVISSEHILNAPQVIDPEVLGQLMKLSSFGLERVYLQRVVGQSKEAQQDAKRYLSRLFSDKLQFINVVSKEETSDLIGTAVIHDTSSKTEYFGKPSWYVSPTFALEHQSQSKSVLTYNTSAQSSNTWLQVLFNWLSESNAILHISSANALRDFSNDMPLLNAMSRLLSSGVFARISVNQNDFYFMNETENLVAVLLEQSNKTVFLVLNETNKQHAVPLPFGFMAVAKVTRWQTSEVAFTSFVTSSPLSISPNSLALIIRN